MAAQRFFTGRLRLAYWIIMLTAIGILLWYIRQMLAPYNELVKP